MTNSKEEPEGYRPPAYIYWVFGACFALWVAWGAGLLAINHWSLGSNLEGFGQVGDAFGAVNALFTALAFAAVWWTGWMQREELKLQRDELASQRGELINTREVIRRQNFETTFFNQMHLFKQISDGMRTISQNPVELKRRIAYSVVRSIPQISFENDADIKKKIEEFWVREYYEDYEDQLGSYFRVMYHMFKLVDSQEYMDFRDKCTYANLARAQLGSNALILLAVNASTSLGDGFVYLIERYGILKHLPRDPGFFGKISQVLPPGSFLAADERSPEGM